MEFDLNGGPPRILAENVPSPNAMEVGPDGLLYFPVMGANEIWRIDLDGGVPETVATGLGVPDSVKFDAEGFIVSTQVASGQVLRIDPRTGEQRVMAQLNPGLDNCTFVGGRLFVSNFTGEITEIVGVGATRTTLPGALNWPLDLAVGHDGRLYVADGTYFYAVTDDGSLETVGMLFSPGYPGFLRGLVPSGPGEFVVDHLRRADRPLPAGARRNRLPGRRFRPAVRRGDHAERHRRRRTGHRAGGVGGRQRQRRGDRLRAGRPRGRGGHRRRRCARRGVRRRSGGSVDAVGRRARHRRIGPPTGHPRDRWSAVRRRRGREVASSPSIRPPVRAARSPPVFRSGRRPGWSPSR